MAAPTSSDTAGVRIEEVNPEGPAAKAGLKSGMIITTINGVSLRISPQDAADRELSGVAQRRLTRTLSDLEPGDEVELQVLEGRERRTIRVTTVAATKLMNEATRRVATALSASANRASLGISIGMTGSDRDTLGLFVHSVVSDGPAEKAGVIEGDRIAQINGVDVRVPKEDVEDTPSRMARVTRFNRELQKLEAGASVTLRVWKDGRYRDVTVATVKASELPNSGLRMFWGSGNTFMYTPEVRALGEPLLLRNWMGGAERERLEKLLDEARERAREAAPRRQRTALN